MRLAHLDCRVATAPRNFDDYSDTKQIRNCEQSEAVHW